MIKRTGEVTLSVIGLILGLLLQLGMTIVSFAVVRITDTQSGLDSFNRNYIKGLQEANINQADVPSASTVIDGVHTFAGLFLAVLIITFILGILGIIFITKNRKPVLAGVIFLILAILILFSTLFVGFIPALLFLIAAIMCWARKPRNSLDNF
ncbi:DUF4064 domain-containing protein [Listeria sp. PSOL-1]|uniref:DUF4064 domain-containing protein n=1 Tax=Listeria sp. PSOL-1 TaxID=1844999 RepID=UPI0013D42472|nr:DUF4064 domain-containing protein [Listeria sp. PSOL-1]